MDTLPSETWEGATGYLGLKLFVGSLFSPDWSAWYYSHRQEAAMPELWTQLSPEDFLGSGLTAGSGTQQVIYKHEASLTYSWLGQLIRLACSGTQG